MSLQNEVTSTQPDPRIQEYLVWYSSSWVVRAVESLVSAKDFDPSAKTIAQRLNITVEQAVESLEALEKLGYIIKKNNTYIKVENVTVINQAVVDTSDLLKIHSNLAPQIMTKLDEESIFTTRILLGSMPLVKKHSHKLIEFLKSLNDEGEQLEHPDVLAVEISIAKISTDVRGVQ